MPGEPASAPVPNRAREVLVKNSLQQFTELVNAKVGLANGQESKEGMTAADIKFGLKQTRQWLQKFTSKEMLPEVCNTVWKLVPDTNVSSIKSAKKEKEDKVAAPSTQDAKDSIDTIGDDESLSFLVLETLRLVFGALLQKEGVYRKQDEFVDLEVPPITQALALAPPTLHQFFWGLLKHDNSPAVRNVAAQCLGLFSHQFLAPTVALFCDSMTELKEKGQREFVSYQHALSHIAFGFSSENQQAALTAQYLTALGAKMKMFTRGVLRQEVCSSLQSLFSRILDRSESKSKQLNAFFSTESKERTDFLAAYETIFSRTVKWSKKAKHTLFCHKLLTHMLCLAPTSEFYQKYGGDLLQWLMAGLKAKETRGDYIRLWVHLIREIRQDHLERDEKLVKLFKDLLHNIFPTGKGKAPAQEDVPLVVELVPELALRRPAFIAEYMITCLKKKSGYSTECKATILAALGQTFHRPVNPLQQHLKELGVMIRPLILHDKERNKGISRLIGALNCFSFVVPWNDPACMDGVGIIAGQTLHPHRGVSTAALTCCMEYMTASPQIFMIPILHASVEIMRSLDLTNTKIMLRLLANLNLMLRTCQQLLAQMVPGEKTVDPNEWVTFRQYMEATSCIWLCHHDPWIRGEVLNMAMHFAKLRPLEAGATGTPFLVDALKAQNLEGEEGVTPKLLFKVMRTQFDDFQGVFAFVFSALHAKPGELLAMDAETIATHISNDSFSEWYLIFKNVLQVLTLSLRKAATSDEGEPITSVKSTKAAQDWAELKLTNVARPRHSLTNYLPRPSEVAEFFNIIYQTLHSPIKTPEMHSVQRAVTSTLGDLNWVVRPKMTQTLRQKLDDPEAKEKSKKKSEKSEELARKTFFYHEHTLDLLAQMLLRTNAEQFHSGKNALTMTLDEMVARWPEETSCVEFTELNARSKNNMAAILGQYLVYRLHDKPNKDHSGLEEALKRRGQFFEFVTGESFLYSTPTKEKDKKVAAVEHLEVSRDRRAKTLEQVVVRVVLALVLLGPINDFGFENKVLAFLHHMPMGERKMDDGLLKAFRGFLKTNPHRLEDFIRNSMPKEEPEFTKMLIEIDASLLKDDSVGRHQLEKSPSSKELERKKAEENKPLKKGSLKQVQRTAASPRLDNDKVSINPVLGLSTSMMSMRDLSGPPESEIPLPQERRRPSIVLAHDIKKLIQREGPEAARVYAGQVGDFYLKAVCFCWIANMETWKAVWGITPARMLSFSLLHQTSPSLSARDAALRLAQALANRSHMPLDPGYNVLLLSHTDAFMYRRTAFNYSRALAFNEYNSTIISPMIRESARLYSLVNGATRSGFFELLLPWIQSIGSIVAQSAKTVSNVSREMKLNAEKDRRVTSVGADEGKHPQLLDVLQTEAGADSFLAYLNSEHSQENLHFWRHAEACSELLNGLFLRDANVKISVQDNRRAKRMIAQLLDTYISATAPAQINIPSKLRNAISQLVNAIPLFRATWEETSDAVGLTREQAHAICVLLTDAENEVYNLMSKDSFKRYKASSFYTQFAMSEEDKTKLSDQFHELFGYLLKMTHEATKSSFTAHIISELWEALLSTPHKTVLIPALVKFLVREYASNSEIVANALQEDGSSKTEAQELLRVIKMVYVAIARAPCAELVIEHMVSMMRGYRANDPVDPVVYFQWQQKIVADPELLTNLEKSAFELFVDVAFENGSLLKKHLSRILQNLFVFFDNTPYGKATTQNIATAICLEEDFSGKDLRASALIQALLISAPDVVNAWALEALDWAVLSQNQDVACKSLQILRSLEGGRFYCGSSQTTLKRLILTSFLCIRLNQSAKLAAIVSNLKQPAALPFVRSAFFALSTLGWGLLSFSSVSYYQLGIELLTSVWGASASSTMWISQAFTEQSFLTQGERPDPAKIEEAVVYALVPGLMSIRTREATLAVLVHVSKVCAPKSRVVGVCFLSLAIFRCIDVLELLLVHNSVSSCIQTEEELVDKLDPILSFIAFLKTSWSNQGAEVEAIRILFLRLVLGIAPQLVERDSLRVTASSPLFVPTTHSPGTNSIPYAHFLTSPIDASLHPSSVTPLSPAFGTSASASASFVGSEALAAATANTTTARSNERSSLSSFASSSLNGSSSSSSLHQQQSSASPSSSRPSHHKASYSFASSALLGPETTSNSFHLAAANEEKKNLLGYRDEAKRVSQRLQNMKDMIDSWAAAEPSVVPAIGRSDRARLFNSLEQQDGEARVAVNGLMKAFMKPFCALFADRASFDFFLSVFTQLLRCMQGPTSWRVVCLSALGSFLQANPKHQATEAQSTALGDVLGLLYEPNFEKQVENVAQLLVDFNPNFRQGFSWVRPKPKLDPRGVSLELLNQHQWEKSKESKHEERRDACLKLVERVGGAALALKETQHDARYDSRASMVVHANTNRDVKLTLGRRGAHPTPKSISAALLSPGKNAPGPPSNYSTLVSDPTSSSSEGGSYQSAPISFDISAKKNGMGMWIADSHSEQKVEPRSSTKIVVVPPSSSGALNATLPRNSLLSSPKKAADPTPQAVALVDSFLDLLDDPDDEPDKMTISPLLSKKMPPPPPVRVDQYVESRSVIRPAVVDSSDDDEPVQG